VLAFVVLGFTSSVQAQAVAAGKNELETNVALSSSKLSGVDANRTTEYLWGVTYARFLSNRFAIGPVFEIHNDPDNGLTPYNIGGLARLYLGNPSRSSIPFLEAASTRAFNQLFDYNYTDFRLSGGLLFPMGSSGGRFRIAPYYYRALYDDQVTGYGYSHSFGVSWSVGLLF
jgi:hypothetical protein